MHVVHGRLPDEGQWWTKTFCYSDARDEVNVIGCSISLRCGIQRRWTYEMLTLFFESLTSVYRRLHLRYHGKQGAATRKNEFICLSLS